MDPRTPVIVGTGQITHRDAPVPSPLELMAQAVRAAAQDSTEPDLAARAEVIACVDGFSWPVPDPGALLKPAVGNADARTWRTTVGGNGPIALLGALAQAIADGDLDVAVLAGGEAFTPFKQHGAQPPPDWPSQPGGAQPDRVVGVDEPPSHEAELAAGLIAPIFVYPLFEQALRRTAGHTPEEHQRHLGKLCARLAEVARTNPHAWTQDPSTDPHELATPSPANRLVSLPYTKVMNANIAVDQAAALILTSAGKAAALGIPKDRWVAVHGTAQAHDHWFVCSRDALDRSPAIAATTRAALTQANACVDDLTLLDLYSCFPSAVQVAANEIGYDPVADPRAPTVTGGLGFAGGPANNYVTHALATMAGTLREDPDALGLSTAVGWYLTKHGAAVLGASAPKQPFRDHDVQAEVDATPQRAIATEGTGTVESATALFDRDGTATLGIVTTVRDRDGARVVAQTQDRGIAQALADADPLGRPVTVAGSTSFVLA